MKIILVAVFIVYSWLVIEPLLFASLYSYIFAYVITNKPLMMVQISKNVPFCVVAFAQRD
jgi:hypothetical protein